MSRRKSPPAGPQAAQASGGRNIRVQRVSSVVREAVTEILLGEIHDPRVASVSVTDVELSGDLREAQIYYHVHGDEQERAEAAQALDRCAGFVRRELAQRVSLRHIPSITFRWDRSVDHGARIEAKLAELGLGAQKAAEESAPGAGEDDGAEELDS